MKKAETVAALKAGFLYFLGIFALGFILGTIRTILLVPRIGPLAGVLLEIPVMLTVSWFFCRRLIVKYSVKTESEYLFIFGGSAFLWLMAAEALMSVLLFGQTWNGYITGILNLPGALGLSAQIVFGIIPVIQKRFFT